MTGRTAQWHAWSHHLMGQVTDIDVRATSLLALGDAHVRPRVPKRLTQEYAAVSLAQRAILMSERA